MKGTKEQKSVAGNTTESLADWLAKAVPHAKACLDNPDGFMVEDTPTGELWWHRAYAPVDRCLGSNAVDATYLGCAVVYYQDNRQPNVLPVDYVGIELLVDQLQAPGEKLTIGTRDVMKAEVLRVELPFII
jgi:hypothetical protein